MVYNKYPTTFSTHEEFWKILNSIPWKDRSEWAENLDPKLLRMKDNDGWTVAHFLAKSGTLPEKFVTEELLRMKDDSGWTVAHDLAKSGTLPEKFITEELLRVKDNDGRTVAGCYFDFLSENNRWDLLTPMLFSIPYRDKTPIIDQVAKYLSGMNDGKLEEALFLMPRETQMKLLSDIKIPIFLKE